MKKSKFKKLFTYVTACFAGLAAISLAACAEKADSNSNNLIATEEKRADVVNLFGPMEKTDRTHITLRGRRLT